MQFSWRKFLFQLSLIAFLFGAVVPFFANYEGLITGSSEAELTALYGEEIFLCTENGFEWVKVADIAKKNHTPKPDKHMKCGLCYMAANGTGYAQVPPIVLAVSAHNAAALRLHFATTEAPKSQLTYLPSFPRAPPVIS